MPERDDEAPWAQQLRFVTREVTPEEAAAVTAVLTAVLSDHAQAPTAEPESAWVRSGRASTWSRERAWSPWRSAVR